MEAVDTTFNWPALNDAIRSQPPNALALQIGANDGELVDPLYPHIQKGLRAHLVEPHPSYFADLEKLHQENPRVTLTRAAIGNRACSQTLYYLSDEILRDLPPHAKGAASFSRDHLTRYGTVIGHDLDGGIQEIEVPVITYGRLLGDLLTPPGILVVDAEGQDLDIVGASLDDPRPSPNVIMFEHEHAGAEELGGMLDRLDSLGYTIEQTKDNTLAVITAQVGGLNAQMHS